MNIAICDDIREELEVTEKVVLKFFPDARVFHYSSGETFLDAVSRGEEFGLVFLDIVLETEQTGIDIKKSIISGSYKTCIVFTTRYDKFEKQAWGPNVLGFIKKPVDVQKLKEVIDYSGWKLLRGEKIAISSCQYIQSRDILYMETFGHFIKVFLVNGTTINTDIPLSNFVKILNSEFFFRLNRSVIIAYEYIDYILTDGIVIMKNGRKFKCRNREYRDVKNKWYDFLDSHSSIM